MNLVRHIRHFGAVLAGILAAAAGALLAAAAASPALAITAGNPVPFPPDGGPGEYVGDPYIGTAPVAPIPVTTVHVVSSGGMAGWQIALIAVSAALLAAALAVRADRARAAHHKTVLATRRADPDERDLISFLSSHFLCCRPFLS